MRLRNSGRRALFDRLLMGERRRRTTLTCGLIAIAASLVGAPSAWAGGETTFFALSPATHAVSIAASAEEGIWFSAAQIPSGSDSWRGVIGRVGGDGRISELVIPPKRSVGKIAEGADGNLWFTESYRNRSGYPVARIGRVSPAGEFSEHRLGNHVGGVRSLAAGSDGNLWFTTTYLIHRRRHHAIGRITTSGTVARFALPPHSQPGAIVAGPDGNLWFTERGRGEPGIGRITRSGQITHFPLRHNWLPRSITVGPDDNLWFSGERLTSQRQPVNRIGRITAAGAITEFPVPGRGGTEAIAAGPAGSIWFVTRLNGPRVAIDSITPTGTVAKPTCLESTCELVPNALAMGPEGTLWFAAGREAWGYGGSSTFYANYLIAREAGFVGKFSPSPQP